MIHRWTRLVGNRFDLFPVHFVHHKYQNVYNIPINNILQFFALYINCRDMATDIPINNILQCVFCTYNLVSYGY